MLNDSVVEPLVWASAYSEILYTFGCQLAFIAFLRVDRFGEFRVAGVQLAAMVLGFGANELMVTFPAVAAYAAPFAAKRWKVVIQSAALAKVLVTVHGGWLPGFPETARIDSVSAGTSRANSHWASMLGPTAYQRIHRSGAGLMVLGTVLRTASAASWVIVAISQLTHRPTLPPLVRAVLGAHPRGHPTHHLILHIRSTDRTRLAGR